MSNKVKVGVIVLLIGLYGGFKMYASSIAKEKIDKAIAENVPSELDIDYKNISVDLLGLGVRISDVVVSADDQRLNRKWMINEIFLADIDDKSEIPTYLDISVNGLHVQPPPHLGKQDTKVFNDVMGIGNSDEPVLLNTSLKYDYNEGKKEQEASITFGVEDVGNLKFGYTVGGIELTASTIDNPMQGAANLSIISMSFSYEDDSMIERLMASVADQEGREVKEVREEGTKETIRELRHAFKCGKNSDENCKLMRDKLEEFINDPDGNGISITVKPQEPLEVMATVGDVMSGKQSLEDVLKNLNPAIDTY